jgi:hypothetical protein
LQGHPKKGNLIRGDILIWFHNTDEREIPIVFIKIKSVAKDELVGDFKTTVMDRDLRLSALMLI